MSDTPENRTLMLEPEVKIELCRLSRLGAEEAGDSILELLPEGLTPREIDSVGLHVLNLRENITPSNAFVSRGARTERDVVRSRNRGKCLSAFRERQIISLELACERPHQLGIKKTQKNPRRRFTNFLISVNIIR
jgi:hypothetical protein